MFTDLQENFLTDADLGGLTVEGFEAMAFSHFCQDPGVLVSAAETMGPCNMKCCSCLFLLVIRKWCHGKCHVFSQDVQATVYCMTWCRYLLLALQRSSLYWSNNHCNKSKTSCLVIKRCDPHCSHASSSAVYKTELETCVWCLSWSCSLHEVCSHWRELHVNLCSNSSSLFFFSAPQAANASSHTSLVCTIGILDSTRHFNVLHVFRSQAISQHNLTMKFCFCGLPVCACLFSFRLATVANLVGTGVPNVRLSHATSSTPPLPLCYLYKGSCFCASWTWSFCILHARTPPCCKVNSNVISHELHVFWDYHYIGFAVLGQRSAQNIANRFRSLMDMIILETVPELAQVGQQTTVTTMKLCFRCHLDVRKLPAAGQSLPVLCAINSSFHALYLLRFINTPVVAPSLCD